MTVDRSVDVVEHSAQPETWRSWVAPVTRSTGQARETYDRLARWYDVVEAPFERRARDLGTALLAAAPGERVLELGSGTGHTLTTVAAQVGAGGLVVGLDLSHGMTEIARRRVMRSRPDAAVAVVQADARRMPVRSHSVDAVTTSFTLELMPTDDIPATLRECRRVLRPGGRLVVVSLSLPEEPSLMTRLYIAGHRRLPRLLDCRPLPLEAVLASGGYTVTRRWRTSIAGISVTAARGQ